MSCLPHSCPPGSLHIIDTVNLRVSRDVSENQKRAARKEVGLQFDAADRNARGRRITHFRIGKVLSILLPPVPSLYSLDLEHLLELESLGPKVIACIP